MAGVDSIEGSGFPLGFQASAGERRPSILGTGTGREIYVVEARKLAGHQKEAVVREGEGGSTWRLASDEGKHLKGTDLAPFPLGYFNAGLHADLIGRIVALAGARSIALDRLSIELKNGYYMTGSFFQGDGHGYGEPATIRVVVQSGARRTRSAVSSPTRSTHRPRSPPCERRLPTRSPSISTAAAGRSRP